MTQIVRMISGTVHWAVTTIALIVIASTVHADSARRVTEARQEYFRLRNNDTGSGMQQEWLNLAQRFQSLLSGALDKGAEVPLILFDSAFVEYRLWRSGAGDSHVKTAIRYLNTAIQDFPNFVHYEEALRLRGDIAAAYERDFSGARKFYQRIGEEQELKTSRILSLVNDTFERFAPAPELPVPDLIPRVFLTKGRGSKLVVLDPGHGGEDSGAVSDSLKEKEFTLELAMRLKEKLISRGYRVHLTRNSDTFLPLLRRTQKANDLGADVFVSLHVNSSPSGDGEGIESYYLDNADDHASRRLASIENLTLGSSGEGGDLEMMVSDLIQTGKLGDSIRLASTIQGGLVDSLNDRWGPIANLGVKKAPFYVLVGAHMPCVLIETLFINNPADSRRLSNPSFVNDTAAALVKGIEDYFKRESVSASGRKRIPQASPTRNRVVSKRTQSRKRKK